MQRLSSSDSDGDEERHILNSHRADARKALRKLAWVSVLCLCFMVIEFLGGYFAHSIAIMTDAAHLLSDFSGFLISISAIIIG